MEQSSKLLVTDQVPGQPGPYEILFQLTKVHYDYEDMLLSGLNKYTELKIPLSSWRNTVGRTRGPPYKKRSRDETVTFHYPFDSSN